MQPARGAPTVNKRLSSVILRVGHPGVALTHLGRTKLGAAWRGTHSAARAAPDVSGGAGSNRPSGYQRTRRVFESTERNSRRVNRMQLDRGFGGSPRREAILARHDPRFESDLCHLGCLTSHGSQRIGSDR